MTVGLSVGAKTNPEQSQVELANRLLEHELGTSKRTPALCAAAAVRIYDKIYGQLAPVIGGVGVQALFARSVMVTKVHVPALGRLDPAGDAPQNAAKPLLACLTTLATDDALVGAVHLYATFLALTSRYIGTVLTRQFLVGAWPVVDMALRETK